jgi:hypothetical protein
MGRYSERDADQTSRAAIVSISQGRDKDVSGSFHMLVGLRDSPLLPEGQDFRKSSSHSDVKMSAIFEDSISSERTSRNFAPDCAVAPESAQRDVQN